MSDPIRVGVLGYGLAGRYFHVPFLRALPDFELRAVMTSREEARLQLPGVRIVSQPNDILTADDIDLVVIASPHRLHTKQAIAAVEAGKHAVVEKPVATTAAEINQLLQAASANRRLIIPYQNRRWDGDFQTVQRLIESGMLGRIHHFETHWIMFRPKPRGVWRDDPDEMGGILNDLGPHLIDQVLQLFGMPQTVYAQVMINRPGCKVDDAFRIHLHYDSGLYALLETDVLNGGTVPRYAIRGTNGAFEKFGVDPQENALRSDVNPGQAGWGSWKEKGRVVCGGEHGLAIDGEVDIPPGDYRQYYAAVAAAVRGEAPSPVLLEHVLDQLYIMEAVRRSSQSGAPVKVDRI